MAGCSRRWSPHRHSPSPSPGGPVKGWWSCHPGSTPPASRSRHGRSRSPPSLPSRSGGGRRCGDTAMPPVNSGCWQRPRAPPGPPAAPSPGTHGLQLGGIPLQVLSHVHHLVDDTIQLLSTERRWHPALRDGFRHKWRVQPQAPSPGTYQVYVLIRPRLPRAPCPHRGQQHPTTQWVLGAAFSSENLPENQQWVFPQTNCSDKTDFYLQWVSREIPKGQRENILGEGCARFFLF